MDDPYAVLGLAPGATEAEVRRRYLERVREFSPERHPERFVELREAYDLLKDPVTRISTCLFESQKSDSIRAVVQEATERLRTAKIPLDVLLSLAEHP